MARWAQQSYSESHHFKHYIDDFVKLFQGWFNCLWVRQTKFLAIGIFLDQTILCMGVGSNQYG